MDRHDHVDASAAELSLMHQAHLAVQDDYDAEFLTYWFDPDDKRAYCLVRAPSADSVVDVHTAAHGDLPSEVIRVELGEVLGLLGRVSHPDPDQHGTVIAEAATRTVVFTDIVGSTASTNRFGDQFGLELVRIHDAAVHSLLGRHGGREVKHTGDGVMLTFASPRSAVEFAIDLQKGLEHQRTAAPNHSVDVRIGMNLGEPIERDQDLFGTTVNLAARLCESAEPDGILISESLYEQISDQGFRFGELEQLDLKGFAQPVGARPVLWNGGRSPNARRGSARIG